MSNTHIALLCATRRGFLVLQKLIALAPSAKLVVFSFKEEPGEPAFFDDIRTLAERHGHRFYEARQLGGERWRQFWEETPLDLMLVVSWRYLIPETVFRRPAHGTFVFHDSLLPSYRGFAPTVWAIANGEDHTGATLFEIAADMDRGPVVAQQRVSIGSDDTIAAVMTRVTEAYLVLLAENLPLLLAGQAPREIQDELQATYTCKRLSDDNRIDWRHSATQIHNLIRAVTTPYPGAFTEFQGQRLSVWAARPLPDFRRYIGVVPGRVVEVRPGEGAVVLTGDGALLLSEVQLEGGAILCAAEVLHSIAHTLGV